MKSIDRFMELKNDLTSSTINEQSIMQEIREIEDQLNSLQPYPTKINSREIEKIIIVILKDYSNIVEESFESKQLVKEVTEQIQHIDGRIEELGRLRKSINQSERYVLENTIDSMRERRGVKDSL